MLFRSAEAGGPRPFKCTNTKNLSGKREDRKASLFLPRPPKAALHYSSGCLGGTRQRRIRTFHSSTDGPQARWRNAEDGDLLQKSSLPGPPKTLLAFPGVFPGVSLDPLPSLYLEHLGGRGLCLGTPGQGHRPGTLSGSPPLTMNQANIRCQLLTRGVDVLLADQARPGSAAHLPPPTKRSVHGWGI